jgi:hypothetical protein
MITIVLFFFQKMAYGREDLVDQDDDETAEGDEIAPNIIAPAEGEYIFVYPSKNIANSRLILYHFAWYILVAKYLFQGFRSNFQRH